MLHKPLKLMCLAERVCVTAFKTYRYFCIEKSPQEAHRHAEGRVERRLPKGLCGIETQVLESTMFLRREAVHMEEVQDVQEHIFWHLGVQHGNNPSNLWDMKGARSNCSLAVACWIRSHCSFYELPSQSD